MPPFRLQYASNLFVDLHKQPFQHLVKPACGQLALLGNIGRPESPKTYHFLKYCSKHWDSVYWVPGAHELTNSSKGRATYIEKTTNALALTKQFSNVMLMNSKEAVFHSQKVVLLGTPLWSHLILPPKGQPEFSTIFTSVDESGPIPLCHHVRNQLHKEDSLFLKERSLFWSIVHPSVSLVYLTHTLPTPLLYASQSHLSGEAWARMRMDSIRASTSYSVRAWVGGAAPITAKTNLGAVSQEQTLCAVNGLYEYPLKKIQNPYYDAECVLEIEPTPPPHYAPLSLPHLILPPLLSSLLERKPILAAL